MELDICVTAATPGFYAYRAYKNYVVGGLYQIREWDQLPSRVQEAWDVVAKAVLEDTDWRDDYLNDN